MIKSAKKASLYPKGHLLAASGIAAVLSLTLLVFPSRDVEAKRSATNPGQEQLSPRELALNHIRKQIAGTAGEQQGQEEPSLTAPSEAEAPGSATAAALKEARTKHQNQKTLAVTPGDTLSGLFEKAGIPTATLQEILALGTRIRTTLTRLKNGQSFDFEFNKEGELARLRFQPDSVEAITVIRNADGQYNLLKEPNVTPKSGSVYAYGVIESSLFAAARKAGISHRLAVELANIFGYDIDFALDLRKGDTFELIYEEKRIKGKRSETGKILAARFTNQGKTYTAIRHAVDNGPVRYYTASGEALRKAFIRTPVDFARISSRFSIGRRHPILNKIRAHKGVDYAAPQGTPIKSAGDGKVVLAGRNGGYGNTVIIQHGQKYRTLYAHMRGFAKGIRNGVPVKQGQIIGYIGTTGLSTGPHLHYEFQINGQHVDPLGQKLALSDPLGSKEKKRLQATTATLLAQMDREKPTRLALRQD